jgi:hypothetical protein
MEGLPFSLHSAVFVVDVHTKSNNHKTDQCDKRQVERSIYPLQFNIWPKTPKLAGDLKYIDNWQRPSRTPILGFHWIWVFWVRDSFESTTPRGCYGNVVQLPIGINLHSPYHHPAISEKTPAAPALTSEYARSSPRNLSQSRKRASQWKKRRVYPWRIHIP